MRKRMIAMVSFLTLAAVPAFAQTPKAEVGVVFGWVYSDGVSGSTRLVPGAGPGGGIGSFDRIDPKDSFGWGVDIGFFVSPNVEVGFMYGQQPSKLLVGGVAGTADREIGDMSIRTYHGTFTYNFFEGDSRIRPYIMGGLGATDFGEVSFHRADNGVAGTLGGSTKFSSTWGAGVKLYGSGRIGGRLGVSWTPTYIKSDASGYWCDPYWGCYLVGDPQYSNQVMLNGGITVRF
jgi:outer membrane protein W